MTTMSRAGILQKTIRRSARLAAAMAVGGGVMLGFAGAAHAGRASVAADCDTATVSWRADGALADADWMYVDVIRSDGSSFRSGPVGMMTAEFETSYRIEYWGPASDPNWTEPVLWGFNEVTTPARDVGCDEPTTTAAPVTPAPVVTPNVPVTPEVVAPPVESAGPVVEAPPIAPEVLSSGLAPQAAGAELPATGRNTDLLLLAGTLTAAAGVSLLIVRRRPETIAAD